MGYYATLSSTPLTCLDHDAVCTELSGYIAASYYAYITGSAGADLFAAIGCKSVTPTHLPDAIAYGTAARVNRWHTVLDGICSAPDAHHQSCDGVYATFDAWVKAAAKVDIVAVTTTVRLSAWPMHTLHPH